MTNLYYYEPKMTRAERQAEIRRYKRSMNIIYGFVGVLAFNAIAMLVAWMMVTV